MAVINNNVEHTMLACCLFCTVAAVFCPTTGEYEFLFICLIGLALAFLFAAIVIGFSSGE